MSHPLLRSEMEPPNPWSIGTVSGRYITFKRRESEEEHHVVIEDDEVWTVTLPGECIIDNFKTEDNQLAETSGMDEGAQVALEYMENDTQT